MQKNAKESKILICGGDSFVYGLDMLDCNISNNFSNSLNTWPALLARHLNREYVCAAYPGSANNAISRKTILACEKNKGKDIFVTVSWSFLNRFEFRFTVSPYEKPFDPKEDPEGYALSTHRSHWISFNIKDLYVDVNCKNESLLSKHFDPTMSKFLKDYYRYVGSDDVWEYYSTLKEIVYLQNYLKLRKIPFIFTAANAFFYKTFDDPNINCLIDQIDFDNWYFFPHLKGFLQWSNDNNYPRRDEHPSEEAHQAAYELIRSNLDTKN